MRQCLFCIPYCTGDSAREIRQEKEIKDSELEIKIKLSLFTDDFIGYVKKNPKEFLKSYCN